MKALHNRFSAAVRNIAYLVLLSVLAWPSLGHSVDYTGVVVRILDGDTVVVVDAENRQHKVRLAAIDAPEKRQSFGNVSRQHLASLVFQRQVAVSTHKQDRYGRELGTVFVSGRDVNLAQVQAGLAWHYKAYAREQLSVDSRAYADAEEDARTARRGLWRDSNPIAPWEFRHRK